VNVGDILTTRQLSQLLQISATTLRRLRAEGIVRAYRIRNCGLRFVLADVLAALGRAEDELPLRRKAQKLVYSDGPRRIALNKKVPRGVYTAGHVTNDIDITEHIAAAIARSKRKVKVK
jgi:predicted site-specific integrase-resolvase